MVAFLTVSVPALIGVVVVARLVSKADQPTASLPVEGMVASPS